MDRRQRRTREAVFEAFGTLLSRKSYGKITVQDIIDEADIGRTTFYAHFETKDLLLREMCAELFEHVFSSALPVEEDHDYPAHPENLRAAVAHILWHFLDNRRNILGILSSEGADVFFRYFEERFGETLGSLVVDAAGPRCRDVPRDFLVNHVSSAFAGMVRWWIRGGLRYEPDELAGYFVALVGSDA